MSDLKEQLIRLAHETPEIREDILPLLVTAGVASDLRDKIRTMEKAMKLEDKYAAELPSEDTIMDNPTKYTGALRRKLKVLGRLDKDLKKAYAAYTSVKVS